MSKLNECPDCGGPVIIDLDTNLIRGDEINGDNEVQIRGTIFCQHCDTEIRVRLICTVTDEEEVSDLW